MDWGTVSYANGSPPDPAKELTDGALDGRALFGKRPPTPGYGMRDRRVGAWRGGRW